jgi:ankyrin repeat protein
MSDHRLRFCIGASLLLALVCGNAALAGGPLFPGAQYAVGDSPASVAVGDLDGDEGLDLAVANGSSDNVSVLLNNGDGTFARRMNYFAGDAPSSVAVGDLDGDGWLDLAVANFWDDNVSVLLNRGGRLPGDVDGDGDVDWVDLISLLDAYGACEGEPSYDPNADFDRNGCINLCDLARLLSNFGAAA